MIQDFINKQFFFTLLVEVITYVAIIWIYRGFKELS